MNDISDLKQIIIDELKVYSAYILKAICEKYNIIPSEELNPMKSKRVFLDSGLSKLTYIELKNLARRIIIEENNPNFVKSCDPYLDDDFFEISMITRRKTIDWLCNQPCLEGKLRIDAMLLLFINIKQIPSKYGRDNAEEDILQHMVRNDDLSYKELLEDVLCMMYVSDDEFKCLLKAILHPQVRTQDEQLYYTENINSFLIKDNFRVGIQKYLSGEPVYDILKYSGDVNSEIKNLVFASCGKKPDIVIDDALCNDIKIIDNDNSCLFYTLPINEGLTWNELVVWWNKGVKNYTLETEKSLVGRLKQSLDSEPEKLFLRTYYNYLYKLDNKDLPALIPQVYCHYDPKTASMRNGKVYVHQRMDFLLLLQNNKRVIIEIDGKQHYSLDDKPSPKLYAEMVEDDRSLKLYGYDVYRFGGYEFMNESKAKNTIENFINLLFKSYHIPISKN